MRRIILVVALVALLVVAAVVPAMAHPSSTGLGSIFPALAKTLWPGWDSSYDEDDPPWSLSLGELLGLSSTSDTDTEDQEAASNSNTDDPDANNSLNSDDPDVDNLNVSDLDTDNLGSSSSSGSSGSQEFEQEDIESGEASPSVDISNTGDNANLCPAVLQSANTGNVVNQQGVDQYGSGTDDIEFEGSTITITPELVSECTQTIEQAGAAGT
jgi:hypothetical protein